MKKFLFLSLVVITVTLTAVFLYGAHIFNNTAPLKEEKIVLIPRGVGVLGMADNLIAEGVIQDKWVFVAFARATGTYKTLQAGEYQFMPNVRMSEVLSKISRGEIYERRFTIPEGKTSHEIIQILNAVDGLEGEVTSSPKEGSLLPNTYSFQKGETRQDKINMMQAEMTRVVEELWPTRASNLPIKTKEEAVILASIVEKETGVGDERSRVAGVFINRLKIGMLLQTDPTVIYGLTMGKHKNDGQGPLGRRLLRADLQKPNPYNTYLNAGLPPSSIANPGKAAIAAVLNPETHSYLYFVADGKGGHVFATTLEEHNNNVAKWRVIRREMEAK